MPHFDGGCVLLTVWCVGVGGSALALCCLLLETHPGYRYGRSLAGLSSLALSGCASLFWATGYPVDVWRPIAALALASLIAWASHYAAFLRLTRLLAKPRVIWTLLLVVSPLYATYLTWGLNEADFKPDADTFLVVDRDEVANLRLVTDRGREIKLYHFTVSDKAEQAEQEWIAAGDLECHVIRTAEWDPASNCHGWVFTGGRFALRSEDVEIILADNGYRTVVKPQEGDVVVYRNSHGDILHSGLVQHLVNDTLVLVESKWGPLGRFLHPPEFQPYGKNFSYYRSDRNGHLVQLVDLTENPSAMARPNRPTPPASRPSGTPGNHT